MPQVYGDEQAHRDDCFRSFNPTSEEKLQEVVSTWAHALLHMLLLLQQELPRLPRGPLPLEPLNVSFAPPDSSSAEGWKHVPGGRQYVLLQGSLALLTILGGLGVLRHVLLGLWRSLRPIHLPSESTLRAQKSV